MKKAYGILALAVLLLAQPVLAQYPSVGVYFDEAGTQNTAFLPGDYFPPHTAYVIAFAEALVGGAAFKLDVYPEILVLQTTYPAGLQIGDPLAGVEIGLTEPQIGYDHLPVRLADLTIYLPDLMDFARLNTIPHPNYPAVTISDQNGNLFPAVGRCAWITVPVSNDDSTWGAVKKLYQ